MNFSINEVVLGVLLHDIGKPLQRAFGSVGAFLNKPFDMESTLCPLYKGRYTHKHVLFTSAFFDWMKRRGISFPGGVNMENVHNIASYHHKPDTSPNAVGSWICAIADRLSAGMDRRDDESEDETGRSMRDRYRKTPLKCIFDEIELDVKALGVPGRHMYRLDKLNPEGEKVLLPLEWPKEGMVSPLPEMYLSVWESFQEEFSLSLREGRVDRSPQLFEEILLGLLERHFWAVPSSTLDCPDISLFDHLRTSAAIAAALYRFHAERRELSDPKPMRNMEEKKFRFLTGDLSGIQKTLFTLQFQGVKGAGKILRARSFAMAALVDAAAMQVLEAFQLPMSCIVQRAGGRFLILVANEENAEEKVATLRQRFDSWLVDRYTGSLALNLALSDPFAPSDFLGRRFAHVMAQVALQLDEAKFRPLSTVPHGVLKREFPKDEVCSVCGLRPAQTGDQTESRCYTCNDEFHLGRRLVQGRYLLWGRSLPDSMTSFRFFDLELSVTSQEPEMLGNGLLSVQTLESDVSPFPWSYRPLANYVPLFSDSRELEDPRFEDMSPEEDDDRFPRLKTFQHLAALSKEFDDQGRPKGRPYLALVKADVDRLGLIFGFGLRRDDPQQNRMSLSRVAQLSRMLDLYFTGYLKGLLKREFPDTYTVYAGGDDLLLIGPWRQSLRLIHRIYETFWEYTGRNPNVTLSAGVSLSKPNYPVGRSVREAEHFLETAKENGRNRICALISKSMTWNRYLQRLDDADWICEQLKQQNGVSTSFLYNILKIVDDAEAFAETGDLKKANWRARLAYHLARNLRGGDHQTKHWRMVEWLEHLGIDDQLRFVRESPRLYEWRLTLQVALYRNR